MSKVSFLVLFCTGMIFFGCSDSNDFIDDNETSSTEVTKAFFGDKENSRVVVVDVENMKMAEPVSEVFTGHEITYTADKVYDNPKVYVVNRGSDAIDVIDVNTIELTKTIALEHYPRSAETMNATLRLCEASGMNKPMASIIDIDSDEVVAAVGDGNVTYPVQTNHGGSHATGHPFWLDANHFALLDRDKRKIFTYHIEKDANGDYNTTLLNFVDTTTSVHQIIPSKGNYLGESDLFYATAEGSDDDYPSIIELQLVPMQGLVQTREVTLIKSGVDKLDMWLHHGDFHPTQKLIYVGSGDGTLFIVNYEDMNITKTIEVGKGAGHTVMVPQKELAVVINHNDTFVSVIDTSTNTKLADVTVSSADALVGTSTTIQAHPKYHVSEDGTYFYAFLTEEGKMYELNLDTLMVTRVVDVGGKPAQGSFVKY